MKRTNTDERSDELKRQRQSAEEWTLPRDTMVAISLMLSQFPKIDQINFRPFVLKTQLYSSINDRTSVDRELEALKQEQVVRVFKLNSGQDDFGIMLISDYHQKVHQGKKNMESKHDPSITVVFDWFLDHVIPSQKEVSISDSQLMSLLSRGGKIIDKQITVLINAGLLVRQIADSSFYWFSIPNIGSILKSVTQGRRELLQFLGKRRYNEILLSQLENRKLRFSSLGIRFHIRDLLGSGDISQHKSTSGSIIQLSKQ